jgi:hypothetical protein
LSAFNYYINGLITLLVNEKSKQEEWKTILVTAKDNHYPIIMISNIKTKLMTKIQKAQPTTRKHNNAT